MLPKLYLVYTKLYLNYLPRNIEKLKQKITAIYQAQGLNITIDANRKQVNFLDLTLNLENKILNRTSILETLPSM